MRRFLTLLAPLLIAALIAGSAEATLLKSGDPAPSARAKDDFVKHQETNWTWFGPRSFVAVASAYGITIIGPEKDGTTIDYGGSSIFCDGNPQQHFANQRNSFANTPGLKQVRLRQVSNIRQNGGTFSQTMKWSGRAGGVPVGGSLGMQYSSYDGTYCYQATLYKGAIDNRRFPKSLNTLDAIWDRTFYSGPGLPINPSTGLPRQR